MANLTVTVAENLTIEGADRGNTITETISGIIDTYERLITVPTTEVTIYSTHATDVAGATFDKDLVKYSRFTNKDDTNNLRNP